MKRIFSVIFLFYCFVVTLTTSVNAFEFVKSPSNPLNISYIQDYNQSLQVHVFKQDNIYRAILTAKKTDQSYYSLVLIESFDSIDWVMKKEILTVRDVDISNPRLFIDKDNKKKILFSKNEGNDFYQIYSIDCDDNFICSQTPILFFNANRNDITEDHGYFAPYLIFQDDVYYLFYSSWGSSGFTTKLAYSNDLINWNRCQTAIYLEVDGGFPYIENNEVNLFVHRSDSTGLQLLKTRLPLSCESVWVNQGYQIIKNEIYDLKHIIYPSILNEGYDLKLFYSGLGSDSQWRFNLAQTTYFVPTDTPILTPTPTIISLPTPTLAPEKIPNIIIPGLLASWNKEALLHNKDISQDKWTVAPFVNEYTGLINTFKNLGYIENSNLFVFAYDWRKSLDSIVDDLNIYTNKLSSPKFNIIGHSLGGLVARIYSQKYGIDKIKKLITVGSPHKGAAQVYKMVEAGEIEKNNTSLYLAAKLLLMINKNNIETDKETINKYFPILKDLLPTYDYLTNLNNQKINLENMSVKNDYLINKNKNLDNNSISILSTVVGKIEDNTLWGYKVKERGFFDKLLDYYVDGKPIESILKSGDGVVVEESASMGNDVSTYNLYHADLIYKKESIKEILNKLNIDFTDSQITEGKGTILSPSIIFLIKSPANIEVSIGDKIYKESDGIIFIENPVDGNYKLKVIGIENGNYELIVGEIGTNNDVWQNIYGQTSFNKVDIYEINFKNDLPLEINNQDLLAYLYIKGYKIRNLKNLNKIFHELIKKRDFIGLEKLEKYELSLNNKQQQKIDIRELRKELEIMEMRISKISKPLNSIILEQITKRIETIRNEIKTNNFKAFQILIRTIKELLKIINK